MPRGNTISSSTKNFWILPLVILFITLGLLTRVQAQGPVVLTDEQDEYPLGLHLEVLEDPTRQLTIDEVASPEFDRQFVRNQTPELNLGLADSVYWVRFQVSNQTRQTSEWWLENAAFQTDNLSLYYPHPDGHPGFAMKQTGNAFPAASQEIRHQYPTFSLPLLPQSEATIYLRVESQRINLPLTLRTTTGFLRKIQEDFMILGLYLGILFIMAGYNFFLFLTLRDKSYLYYVLFIIGLLLSEVLQRRLPHQYLWPNQVWLNTSSVATAGITVFFIFLLRFTASFLATKIHTPQLHQFFNGLQVGLGVGALLFLLWPEMTLFFVTVSVLGLLSMIMVLITGLIIWWQGYRPARYFMLALSMLLGAGFVSVLIVLGVLPTSYVKYLPQTAVILMTLFMSLALADRINIIKQEREQAEAETSQRNRELTLLNQIITATTAAVEPETVLEAACRELVQAFNLTHAIAVLADENNSKITVVADYCTEDQLSLPGQSFAVEGNPLLEYIAAQKKPLAVEDAQHDPRTVSIQQQLQMRNTVSFLMFPLIVEKEIIGGISLSSNKHRRFSANELNLAQSVAEQVAGALARIRLVEERQQLEVQ